jgi:hypothetical protein
MQPYYDPTRRNMENGRRPIFFKRKTTSIFVRVEDDPKQNNAIKSKNNIFFEMEDDLKKNNAT